LAFEELRKLKTFSLKYRKIRLGSRGAEIDFVRYPGSTATLPPLLHRPG